MSPLEIKIIESIVVIVCLIGIQLIIRKLIGKVLKKYGFSLQRRKLTIRALLICSVLICVVFFTGIWGVKQDQLLVFVSSLLTLLGVAFFAQWSILSNITASIILFFSHPLKIGSKIRLLDKDSPIEGKIEDITFFFVHIRTNENEHITIPNNIVLQKSISIISID
jgi:small-conductance mechanosensitive channel